MFNGAGETPEGGQEMERITYWLVTGDDVVRVTTASTVHGKIVVRIGDNPPLVISPDSAVNVAAMLIATAEYARGR